MQHWFPLDINHDQVHLWIVELDKIHDPEILAKCESVLSEAEKKRWRRFHFEKHRHQFLVSHGATRWILSRYSSFPPDEWRFIKNKYGRPDVISVPNAPKIKFNLSHTDGMAVIGISSDQDIGVDVEKLDKKNASLKIADRFFSPPEVEDLAQQSTTRQQERFFEFWTLKEAFIKAKGMGLSFPLNQFSIQIPQHEPIRISFPPDRDENPDTWTFWQVKSFPGFPIAVCVDSRDGEINHELSVRLFIPFNREELIEK